MRIASLLLFLSGCGISIDVSQTCREYLAAGRNVSGVYSLSGEVGYCEQIEDGGGWLLVYSNANNWANVHASDISAAIVYGDPIYRWYDSRWALRDVADVRRLGTPWTSGPLIPTAIGGANVQRFYDAGLTQVRFEFVRGADGDRTSDWCNTSRKPFPWGVANAMEVACKQEPQLTLCIAGDGGCGSTFVNAGDRKSITLGFDRWDYVFRSEPNYLATGSTDRMVAFWKHTSDQTIGEDYQVRIWLREP